MSNTKEKGFSQVLLLLFLALVLGVGAYFLVVKKYQGSSLIEAPVSLQGTSEVTTFEPLEETENTPEDLNNEVIDELDAIILGIEDDMPDESLDDLSL